MTKAFKEGDRVQILPGTGYGHRGTVKQVLQDGSLDVRRDGWVGDITLPAHCFRLVTKEEEPDFILSRDGKPLFRGSEAACMAKLLNLCPASIDHATKHEGYAIEEATP